MRHELGKDSAQEFAKVRSAVEAILPRIGDSLQFSIENRGVTLNTDPNNPEHKLVLVFTDADNNIEWTMDINEDEEYLTSGRFENAIKSTHEKELARKLG